MVIPNQVTGLPFSDLFNGDGSLDYYYTNGLGKSSDYDGVDVTGKVVVVNRGTISFDDKVSNAKAAGASGLVVINTDDTDIQMTLTDPTIPVALIENSYKTLFGSAAKSGTVTFTADASIENSEAGEVSYYSSNGGTTDGSLGPEISAPGNEILGAVNGTYETMSGTSMATPNLSGIEALLIGQNGDDSTYKESLIARMQSTTDILHDPTSQDGDDLNYASPRQQGAGQVDVHKALTSPAYLTGVDDSGTATDRDELSFANDSSFSSGIIHPSFYIHNDTYNTLTYNAAIYVAVPEVALGISQTEYDNLTDLGKEVVSEDLSTTYMQTTNDHMIGYKEFDTTITVYGGSTEVTLPSVNFTTDFATDDGDNPFSYVTDYFSDGVYVEGYIVLTPTDDSATATQLSIPYTGFYGDYGTAPVTEAFDFEKEDGTAYNSDILNAVARSYTGDTALDYGSYIYATSGLGDVYDAFYDVFTGSATMADYSATKLGNDDGSVSAGASGTADQLLIQQYVNRNALYGTVSIVDGDGKTLNSTYLESYPYEGVYSDYPNMLFKSLATESGLESGWIAPMAIGSIDLASSDGTPLADGEYTLRFNYVLEAEDSSGNNYVQTKDVTLNVDTTSKPDVLGASLDDYGYLTIQLTTATDKVRNLDTDVEYSVNNSATTGKTYILIKAEKVQPLGVLNLELTDADSGAVSYAALDVRNAGSLYGVTSGEQLSATDYFYFDKESTSSSVTFTVNIFTKAGVKDTAFTNKSHGYLLDLGNGKTISNVYEDLGNGNQLTIDSSDYSYDSTTGYLTVANVLGAGAIVVELG